MRSALFLAQIYYFFSLFLKKCPKNAPTFALRATFSTAFEKKALTLPRKNVRGHLRKRRASFGKKKTFVSQNEGHRF